MKPVLRSVTMLASALLLAVAIVHARNTPAPSDLEVRTALVYKIAKFVAWPERAQQDPATLRLCHMTERNAARSLATLTGQTVGARSIVVQALQPDEDPTQCDILYIAAPEEINAIPTLRRIADQPVLTIGESSAFAARLGGVMTLRTDTRRVRFEVNVAASRRAGLQINSQLLKLATIVDAPAKARTEAS
jgi:hypothetical protein